MKKVKVYLLKACHYGKIGDTVLVTPDEADGMCQIRQVWDGEKLVDYAVAQSLEAREAELADTSIDGLTAGEMAARGLKNVVPADTAPLHLINGVPSPVGEGAPDHAPAATNGPSADAEVPSQSAVEFEPTIESAPAVDSRPKKTARG